MTWITRQTPPARFAGFHIAGRPLAAVLSILGAVLLLSLSDALVKLASDRLAVGQLFLCRSVVAAGLIVIGVAVTGRRVGPQARLWRRLRLRRPRWVWLRSLCLAGMWGCYYASLPMMPFATAAACYYTAPLWMALLTRVLVREPVGRVRGVAIGIGFAGVVLALWPDGGAVVPPSIAGTVLALGAGLFYALAAIVTWSRCAEEAPAAMALNLNLVIALGGGAWVILLGLVGPADGPRFLLAVWPVLSLGDWGLIALLGGLLAIIATAVAFAYRSAPAPVVGVFDNAYLGFAALWGGVLFGDWPGPIQAGGLALIGCAAIMAAAFPASPGEQISQQLCHCLPRRPPDRDKTVRNHIFPRSRTPKTPANRRPMR